MTPLQVAVVRLASTNPSLRPHLLPLVTGREAAWENLPKGWTQDSVKSMWDTMTDGVKHKITKCMEKMEGKVDNTGAFCGSLAAEVGYKRASAKSAGWAGWTEHMPVQVVADDGTTVYPNLEAARRDYPKLDPDKGGGGFHWAMRGEVNGRPAIRFESFGVYRQMYASRDASLLKRAMVRVAHEDRVLRAHLLPMITRGA